MTEYIGGVPISSVQEVQIDSGEEIQELDLVDKDSNILITGSNTGEQIEITFTLFETDFQGETIEEKRQQIKGIVDNEVTENDFIYDDIEAFLSVESVNVSESSSIPTIREGSISAKLLHWPKNFPDEKVLSDISGYVYSDFYADGDVNIILSASGEINTELLLTGRNSLITSLDTNINGELSLQSQLSNVNVLDGKISSSLDAQGGLDIAGYGYEYGTSYGQ